MMDQYGQKRVGYSGLR